MTPEFTTEQLTQSMKDWAPAPDLAPRLSARLKRGGVEAQFQESLAAGLALCARSTYDYLQCIHDFATNRELNAKNLLPQMAHWAFLIQNLKVQAAAYGEAFQAYNAAVQPKLKRDTFDTQYYDAILGLDVREMLKGLLGEVEVLLQSMTLASQELAGVDGLGIYEACVRFQLFLQYLLIQEKFNLEEMWSVLFDLSNLLNEALVPGEGPTSADLEDLHGRVKGFKSN